MSSLYEDYHINCAFNDFGVTSFQAEKAVAAYPDAVATLDFGCGNGFAVRQMRQAGHSWHGLEYSRAAFEQHLHEPYFHLGDTRQFRDRQFDLVYSTEVMEHIPEEQIDGVVADLCRITAKYIFMTISLRPSSQNNRFHCTLKPRAWWEPKFTSHGFQVDRHIVRAYQGITLKSTRHILQKWAGMGPIPAAFAENPPYELNGESQFWYFAFRRIGVPRTAAPTPIVPWHRRKIFPLVRRVLRLNTAA
jgi:SAM-dependent methyltransferase